MNLKEVIQFSEKITFKILINHEFIISLHFLLIHSNIRMSGSWVWSNTTQVVLGENAVVEHMKDYVKPNSKVLCVFGGGSIDKNGARKDVQKALDDLHCEVRWEGGIPANPEYKRCCEIMKVAREFKPDLMIAIGGGSVIDGTKFIHASLDLPESQDPWDLLTKHINVNPPCKLGVVLTLPATGSEWNCGFVISRRETHEKLGIHNQTSYPYFSLIDPRYTMTLPPRQLRNGLYDAMCHCIDIVMTRYQVPMKDNFIFSVMRELVDIGVPLMQPNSSIELHARLIQAASFALNYILPLGMPQCWAIHGIGHMLTAKYGIDHAATLSIITPILLQRFIKEREYKLARAAERVFEIRTGTDAERAQAFITHLTQWIKDIGEPLKVSKCQGVTIQKGDVEEVTRMVMESKANKPFGTDGCCTEEVVREILQQAIQ